MLQALEERIKELEDKEARIYSRANKRGWDEETIQRHLGETPLQLAFLKESFNTMDILKNSSQGYELAEIEPNGVGGVSYIPESGMIRISYYGSDLFVHELTHAGQFETGDIGFYKDGSGAIANDYWDELQAYRAQYSFNPRSVSVSSIFDITIPWLKNIKAPGESEYLYRNESGNHIGILPINKNTPSLFLGYAYPGTQHIHSSLVLKDYNGILFK